MKIGEAKKLLSKHSEVAIWLPAGTEGAGGYVYATKKYARRVLMTLSNDLEVNVHEEGGVVFFSGPHVIN